MEKVTVTLNLTPFFFIWTVAWLAAAALTHSGSLMFVALLPWILVIGFALLVMSLLIIGASIGYINSRRK